MGQIKNIPTTYNGVQFRSRLEARWAVFFDTLGIKWYYEYEGFELPSGWYVPDFWLPQQQIFMEIKPYHPNRLEERLCAELSEATGKTVYLHPGGIKFNLFDDNVEPQVFFANGGWDTNYFWCQCDRCGIFGIEFEGRAHRLCKCYDDDKGRDRNFFINTAAEKAMKMRFW